MMQGAGSFVKKTAHGFTNSFTKMTGSIGKGVSAATFDREYQRQRSRSARDNHPENAL